MTSKILDRQIFPAALSWLVGTVNEIIARRVGRIVRSTINGS